MCQQMGIPVLVSAARNSVHALNMPANSIDIWLEQGRDAVKIKELIKLIEQDGWEQTRMKGSHRQYRHSKKTGTVTVAGKPNADIPPGTLSSILRLAGQK